MRRDGGRIGRKLRVVEGIGVRLRVFERDMTQIHIREASLLRHAGDLLVPSGIALNAGEVSAALRKPEGAASTAPLKAAHIRTKILLQPCNSIRCKPGMARVAFFIEPVLNASHNIERAEEIADTRVTKRG